MQINTYNNRLNVVNDVARVMQFNLHLLGIFVA